MKAEPSVLRDFTVDSRVWLLSGVAIGIGVIATGLAVLLLKAIALSTNLFYYHRWSIASVSPAGSPMGHWMIAVPIVGGLIVGLMARFGSDKIRGLQLFRHSAEAGPSRRAVKPKKEVAW
jgi:chloride channel protein, CIC family